MFYNYFFGVHQGKLEISCSIINRSTSQMLIRTSYVFYYLSHRILFSKPSENLGRKRILEILFTRLGKRDKMIL